MHEIAFNLTVCYVTVEVERGTGFEFGRFRQTDQLSYKQKHSLHSKHKYGECRNVHSSPLLHTVQDANFCHDPFQGK